MNKHKKIFIFLYGAITLLFISILTLFYNYKILESKFYGYAKMSNYLGIERDLNIYTALQDKNMTQVEKNLQLNLMFHLTSIEMDGIDSVLNRQQSKHLLCDKHHKIWKNFLTYIEEKYPRSAKDLEKLCK